MTSIPSNLYVSQFNNNATNQGSAYSGGLSGALNSSPDQVSQTGLQNSAALEITLSDAAKAALAGPKNRTFDEVSDDARQSFNRLRDEVGQASLFQDGQLTVDLSHIDRREIFAVASGGASNAGNSFSPDEQKAAVAELLNRFDETLASASAVTRVTQDYKSLYDAAGDYLEKAGPEERASAIWQQQRLAVSQGIQQAEATPGVAPSGISNDPVAEFMERTSGGNDIKTRDFSSITAEARTVLDRLYEIAKADETEVVFGKGNTSQYNALTRFSGRSLAAIALNNKDSFTRTEVFAAKTEINERVRLGVQQALVLSANSSDPTLMSKNLLAQYASLSSEEREAAGLTKDFYEALKSNYETSKTIASAFSGIYAAGQGLSLVDYI